MSAKSDFDFVDFKPTYDNLGFYGALWEFQAALVAKFKDQHPNNPGMDSQAPNAGLVAGSNGAALRAKLIQEEANELIEELAGVGPGKGSPEAILKEVCDLLYVTVAVPVIMGHKLEKAFEKVHRNNMDKIDTGVFGISGKLKKHDAHPKVNLKDCI